MNKQYIPAKAQEKIFALILKRPENLNCADCSTKGPRWVSLDYGVFICMDCAGAHRTLGPSVTRVRSTNIDGWYQENIDIMESIGNGTANSYWENKMPKDFIKPTINTGLDSLIRFVQEKYVKKRFIPQISCPDPKQQYILTKTTVKPFYFNQTEIKVEEPKVKLGDLIDLDDDFFGVKKPVVETQDVQGQNTHQGTTRSLSPEKDFIEFIQSTPNTNQPIHSLPSLDILTLYKSESQQTQQSQQIIPNKNSNYAYLSNLGNNGYYNQQTHYQQQHFYQSQQQPSQFHSQQTQQSQPLKPNGTINIMDLYSK
ncbi:unnamed protein product [Paramecium sonneborni]|uniref:Arf-GAP domain-containing protein n=1 Tax=Paramecium sonneborni TaxID=65129 RepID=A0A8S1NK26_9CILI|nr:unnamed protein product [Paramecium sonneborni]